MAVVVVVVVEVVVVVVDVVVEVVVGRMVGFCVGRWTGGSSQLSEIKNSGEQFIEELRNIPQKQEKD